MNITSKIKDIATEILQMLHQINNKASARLAELQDSDSDPFAYDNDIAASNYRNAREQIALSYKLNDMNASTNGSTETRDTSAAIDPDFDRFTLGSYHFGSMKIGYIQRAIYYSSKITDNQLKTITS